ncbi:MAG: YARHG domain-containing protein [Ignavibacteriaceae bacterium]|nr:YARHG domain-containing protein [Ignavibacteriaceae bacterium]
MKKVLTSLLFFSIQIGLYANDGVFLARGNQLIPVFETDVSLRKEILEIKKVDDKIIQVDVRYEIFNSSEEKDLTIGFEALSPNGDVNATPVKGKHPYIHDFAVKFNDVNLPFKIAYVHDSLYAQSGEIRSTPLNEILGSITNVNYVDFFYIYYFTANVKPGLNVIEHKYNYDISSSVEYHYYFEYVLTAANRWANRQIDDFRMILDMGSYEDFYISKSFFQNDNFWKLNGKGNYSVVSEEVDLEQSPELLNFRIHSGTIEYSQKNFKPTGELFLFSKNLISYDGYFDYKIHQLPFSYHQQYNVQLPVDEISKEIILALPYARRGFVFNDKIIQRYYESTVWYIPDPDYKIDFESLTGKEKEWLEEMKQ